MIASQSSGTAASTTILWWVVQIMFMHIDTCTHFTLCGIVLLTAGHGKSSRKVLKWKNLSPCTEGNVIFLQATGEMWQKFCKCFRQYTADICCSLRLQRFGDVCEFLEDDLCSRCCATSWNKEHVTHVQEVVCSVVADGRDDCRND